MWVSQAEAGRQAGVSKQRINELVQQGRLGKNAKKQVDLADVLRFFSGERDPAWTESPLAAGGHHAPGGHPGAAADELAGSSEYRDVKTLGEKIKAELAQHELDRRRGLYLPKQEVLLAMESSGHLIAQKLEAVANWAEELAAIDKAEDVRRLLRVKVRELRQELAAALILAHDEAGEDDV